jgi:hypothetical protein
MIQLQGTEKQVAWAETLRAEQLAKLAAYQAKAERLIVEKPSMEDGDLQLLLDLDCQSMSAALRVGGVNRSIASEKVVGILATTQRWAASQASAKWWIDNGTKTTAYLVSAFCKKHVKAPVQA